MTSGVLKLIEKVVIIQTRNFLDPKGYNIYDEERRKSYFSDQQDGFRENKGTINSLIKVSQIAQRILTNGHGV